MKTSTLLLALLFVNSSVLLAQFASWLSLYINPFAIVGSEAFLIIGFACHKILKDVRNVFDVDVTL